MAAGVREAARAPLQVYRPELFRAGTDPDLAFSMKPFEEFFTPEVEVIMIFAVCLRCLESPEAHVVSSAGAEVFVCRNLKGDVVRSVKQIEGTDRGARIWRVEDNRPDFVDAVANREWVRAVPAGVCHDCFEMTTVFDNERKVDRVRCPTVSSGDIERDVIVFDDEVVQAKQRRDDNVRYDTVGGKHDEKCRNTLVGIRIRFEKQKPDDRGAYRKDQDAPDGVEKKGNHILYFTSYRQ